MRKREKVDNFSTVTSGGFTTLSIDPTGHYYGLMIVCEKGAFAAMSTAEIIADIDNITVELGIDGRGTEEIVNISPLHLFDIMDWKHGAKSAYAPLGVIPIPFTRNLLNNVLDDNTALGLGTLNVNKISVAITFKTNAGFLATRVSLRRDIDEDINVSLGTYPVLYSEEKEINTTGEKPIKDLPKQIAGAAHLSTHFTEGAATVAEVVNVKIGSQKIIENMDDVEHDILAHENGRTPQAGYWHIDHQRARGMLSIDNTKSYKILVNYTVAPGSFYVIYDMLKGVRVA